jgi:hypothetical protein
MFKHKTHYQKEDDTLFNMVTLGLIRIILSEKYSPSAIKYLLSKIKYEIVEETEVNKLLSDCEEFTDWPSLIDGLEDEFNPAFVVHLANGNYLWLPPGQELID